MKLLAFSDLHRNQAVAQKIVDASRDADVIIGAGDFATRREGALETLHILRHCAAPVIVIHGNHDDPDELSRFCAGWDNGHYLHGTSVMIAGQLFFGVGGEIPSRNVHDWNAAETEEHAAETLAHCPKEAVLITHTPPLGVADLQKNGANDGSTAIRDAAANRRPRLLLCGHIHNAWGMTGRIGPTPVHNLGPGLNWFDL